MQAAGCRESIARFTVTKSRKLFVAAALLAGGYGAACFLGGTPSSRGSNGNPNPLASEADGLFSGLRKFASGPTATAPAGQLVPDNGPVANASVSPMALVPQQTPLQPTWLTATQPARETLPVIEPPRFSEPIATAESRPIAVPEPPIAAANSVPSAPKARITDVATAASNEQAASPWDRWPWWDANAPSNASAGRQASLSTASLNQAPEVGRAAAIPASFSFNEPTHAVERTLGNESSADLVSERTHVVVDGDSLAKLADRYLDDAALGEEIYQLNKDVLNDPELLPIGVELRIPDNRVAHSTQRFAGAIGMQAAHSSPPPGMVPVDWKPRPFDSEPRAQLLSPVPAGRND
jgi:nucleoid-associated protein YgaU